MSGWLTARDNNLLIFFLYVQIVPELQGRNYKIANSRVLEKILKNVIRIQKNYQTSFVIKKDMFTSDPLNNYSSFIC